MYKRGRSIVAALGALVMLTATACANSTATDAPAMQESDAQEAASDNSLLSTSAEQLNTTESSSSENSTEEAGEEKEEEIPALRDSVEEKMGCRIGCAITGKEPWDIPLWNLVTTHFNAVTLGNELKPDSLFGYSNGACPGTTEAELNGETITVPVMNFDNPEKILNKFLKWNEVHPDRQIKVRGHVLVWHSQTPEWFFHEDYDKNKPYVSKEEMDKRQEWYIREVLTHFTGQDSPYKDLFYGWDVVNEAVSDGTGTYRSDNENPNEPLSNDTHGNNSSWWHVYQSEEFIINAFKYANKYAPAELELYYNDYNECMAKKREGIVALLKAVKDQEGEPGVGTRITAMGMQGHYSSDSPSYTEVETSAKAYGDVVGAVQITEWDLSSSDDYDGSPESKEKEYEKMRKQYNLQYYALQEVQKSGVQVTGITFWGTVDKYSWLQHRSTVGGGSNKEKAQCPLLFDDLYKPKPAFWVFAETN